MTVELVSDGRGRSFRTSLKTLGKLLHIARCNGWWPKMASEQWPSDSWNTDLILPHLGAYMPGRVSPAEAGSLVQALNRANATGELAMEPSLHFVSLALVDLARAGGFEVRFRETAVAAPA